MTKKKQPQKKAEIQGVPTGDDPVYTEIYNTIMIDIEPELTTYFLPMLDDAYASETPKEKKERTARYEKACDEFARRLELGVDRWKKAIVDYKQAALAGAKERSKQDESKELHILEQQFHKQ